MYLEHFGLERSPFKITPDPSLFYSGGKRGAVLDALVYAVTHGEGITRVVGEVGSGKTMLCRMLETRLPANISVVYIANPSLSPDNILQVIAYELRVELSGADKLHAMHALQAWLLAEHAAGRQVVVFIEEAQSMPLATLEEIRLLSNLETADCKLLQMVLFGQPELDRNLDQPAIRQLRERISHSFYLAPLVGEELHEYLNFRMRHAGYKGLDMFSMGLARLIEKYSQGLLRRVNILADKALLAAFASASRSIKVEHIERAAKDSRYKQDASREFPYGLVAGLLIGLCAGSVGAYLLRGESAVMPAPTVSAAQQSLEQQSETSLLPQVEVIAETIQAAGDEAAAGLASAQASPVGDAHNNTGATINPGLGDDYSLQHWMRAAKHWVVSAPNKHFSIQLFTVAETDGDRLTDALLQYRDVIQLDKVYVYQTEVNSRPMLSVLYNEYPSRVTAEEAMANLPTSLRKNQPFLRTISRLRPEITG